MIVETQGSKSSEVDEFLNKLDTETSKILGEKAEPIMKDTAPTTTLGRDIENIPQPISTKSVGVHFLQEQLGALRDPKKALSMDPFELQLGLEQQGYEMALQRLMHDKEQSLERGDTLNAMNLSSLKKTMWNWHQKLVPLIEEEILRCDAATVREVERRSYGPFLKLLPKEKLGMIAILELLRLHNTSGGGDGMKATRAIIDVGKAVEMEYHAIHMKKSADKTHSRNQDPQALFGSTKLFNMKVRDMQSKSIQNPVANEVYDDLINNGNWVPVWPSTIRAKVGSVLASLVIEAARIPVPSRDPETNQKM